MVVKPVYVHSVGVFGPGLLGWEASRPILAGEQKYEETELPKLAPQRLEPAVRRRTGDYIRLAVEVADEAVRNVGRDPSELATVFSTSDAEGKIAHAICEEVAKPEPMVSPTMFHNSVANAPAGYWCQAVQSLQASTTVAGFDAEFSVGMIESVSQVLSEVRDVMLICQDVRFPEPLHSVRTMHSSFGVALILSTRPGIYGSVEVDLLEHAEPESTMADAELEALRLGNPAARSLPLLRALAGGNSGRLVMPYIGGRKISVRYTV